jgi:hypothetical protein
MCSLNDALSSVITLIKGKQKRTRQRKNRRRKKKKGAKNLDHRLASAVAASKQKAKLLKRVKVKAKLPAHTKAKGRKGGHSSKRCTLPKGWESITAASGKTLFVNPDGQVRTNHPGWRTPDTPNTPAKRRHSLDAVPRGNTTLLKRDLLPP